MRYIQPFILGLILVASQTVADESSYQNQASDATASPSTQQTKATENTTPYLGTSLVSVPTYAEQNANEDSTTPASERENLYKTDYLDGGYYGGHADH